MSLGKFVGTNDEVLKLMIRVCQRVQEAAKRGQIWNINKREQCILDYRKKYILISY